METCSPRWLAVSSLALVAAAPAAGSETVVSFADGRKPDRMQEHHVRTELVEHDGSRALRVDFQVTDWPNVFFRPPGQVWDWSAAAGIAVDLYNPTDVPVTVCLRVDNAGADGINHCATISGLAPPGEKTTLQCRFRMAQSDLFWGMRGIPLQGPVATGAVLDAARITAFQVFLPKPNRPHRLLVLGARLFGKGGNLHEQVPLPFVDRFGQYKHDHWPGKLGNEEELTTRRLEEEADWRKHPELPGRDRYGGWEDGPEREATGWFRTERIDGVWWLVTPDGNLFFSTGMDCVGTWQRTFVTGRDEWFDWLPARNEKPYAELFGEVSGAHSMADRIGGKGWTFGFYGANLVRKYGSDWQTRWRASAYCRLKSWGFNTIGNWSQHDVLIDSPLPFTAALGIRGKVRKIEGARGYWGHMQDVFDPGFAVAVDRSIAAGVKPFARNPLCMGYFVANELSWETVRSGPLASPPDQPCRKEQIRRLRNEHGTLTALNQAWGTTAKTWDALRVPSTPTEACARDLDAFEYAFARRYFEIVNRALKAHAPNQLDLGCRFSTAPPIVVRACADIVDVVSFNRYERRIACGKYTGTNDLGKPILIGEFHFGALDRGMFHTGLVPTRNQSERASAYSEYVQAVADCPAFVGCHWFQYIDEPITGRWFDGENYNIGFLTVVDGPYPELVAAARQVHAEVYQRHRSAGR